jgi:predicted DNA-binding transcriptional regulator AlpA
MTTGLRPWWRTRGPTMDYDFTFVVSGVDVDDQAAVDALLESCDALLARAGGVDLLSITGSGDSAIEAALTVVSAAQAAVPQLKVCRLDRDLVGVHEIAERTGRSRQNVSQWIAGERKAQGEPFPAAEGTVGRSQAWLWSEVNQWLATHGLDDGVAYPTRTEMAQIDVALALSVSSVTLNFSGGRGGSSSHSAALGNRCVGV